MSELTQLRQTAHVDLTRLFQRASIVSSVVVLLISSFMMLGEQVGLPLMAEGFINHLAPMKICCAIAFIASGISLGCLQWRSNHSIALWGSRIFAIAVILLGLLSLGQTVRSWPVEQWLIQNLLHQPDWTTVHHLPLSNGLSFVLVGNALLLSSYSQQWLHRIAQLFTLVAALIAVNAILNNVHPIGLSLTTPRPPMALITALTFLILGAGVQALHLDEAVMQMVRITGGTSEGMVCQLLLAAIALAVTEAFVTLWEQPQTTADTLFNLSFLSIKTVLIFTLLIGWSISLLTRIRQDYQQAEAAVDESLNWFRLAQEAANLGRWDWQIGSNKMRWCFHQEQLFGLTPGSFEGTYAAFLERVHSEDRAAVDTRISQAIANQKDYFDEFRVVWEDASVHWLLSKGHCAYDGDGNVVGISGVSLDITERQQLQEERNQLLYLERAARAKAESANRMKDEFLSVLSHEVRTPLNSVLGWVHLLRSRPLNSDRAAKGFEVLERSAQAQAQIIEDLLDMAQVIQGKLQLHLKPTNLKAVIEAAVQIVRPAAEAKQIRIHTNLESCLPEFPADAERLQQIIWNLLSNAVKFTPAGGTVSISLSLVGSPHSYAQVTVTDTGKGISSEFLPYVFDRFRQEDSTITRKHGGLGLGLALVGYLVELHGGTVEAASEGIGQGATFTVKLPLQAAHSGE